MSELWPTNTDVSRAAEEARTMSDGQLVARLNYLAPELTRDALEGVVVFAMTAPKRPLDGATLAIEQQAREGVREAGEEHRPDRAIAEQVRKREPAPENELWPWTRDKGGRPVNPDRAERRGAGR